MYWPSDSEVNTSRPRTRLISYLLYGLFSGEKVGNVFQYPLASARGHSRSCSLNRNEPSHAIETRRNDFFDNENQ